MNITRLSQAIRSHSCSGIYIAYSGGVDSHVLLHICASVKEIKDRLTAVYINHGLQADAESWGTHCEHVCAALGVKFLNLKVQAHAAKGESPEEAARNARYSALKPLLNNNDGLLLAQHGEDQLETFLLQLFRGSGVDGLSAMPEKTPFGKGYLIRPMLNISKTDILEYANVQSLHWVDDPSNRQYQYDRNFLRNEILPLLKERWPALERTVSRSAKHCAEAVGLISELGKNLLHAVLQEDQSLDLSLLLSYPPNYQAIILRHWFKVMNLRMPSQRVVKQILGEVAAARNGANPCLISQGHEFRRYRGRLYCQKNKKPDCGFLLSTWPKDTIALKIMEELVYELIPGDKGISAELWRNSLIELRFRQGGETIRLPGRAGSHSLKNLFQEAGIPPWLRPLIPLIYLNGELAAVGEYWIASSFYREIPNGCFRLERRERLAKGHDGKANVD